MASWNPGLAYQNTAMAQTYDAARFTSRSGRGGDLKEKRSLRGALACINGATTVMDAACGTGRMTEILLEHGYDVTGVDVSLEMMARAKDRLERFGDNVRFSRASLTQLPFDIASFDMVHCCRLFGHYDTEVRTVMLRELARVSRQWVIIQYFYETPVTRFKRQIKRHVLHEYEGVVYPVAELTLRNELLAAGLQEVERFWCRRYYSEEVFVLCRKMNC